MGSKIDREKMTQGKWRSVASNGRRLFFIARKMDVIGQFDNEADADFVELAHAAFDVMMRRGWGVDRTESDDGTDEKWYVSWPLSEHKHWPAVWMNGDQYRDDPFTALVEADKWYTANIEGKGE